MRLVSEEKGSTSTMFAWARSLAGSWPALAAATSRAPSVGLPTKPLPSSERSAVALTHMLVSRSPCGAVRSPSGPTREMTVMRFSVNVPVLSEQMKVTQPMVSQAMSFLTKAFCLAILSTLIARLMATMVGRPSGTHATMSTMAEMKASPTPVQVMPP